jgi:hypothetical protein
MVRATNCLDADRLIGLLPVQVVRRQRAQSDRLLVSSNRVRESCVSVSCRTPVTMQGVASEINQMKRV